MKNKKPIVGIVGTSSIGHSSLVRHIGQSVPVVVIDDIDKADFSNEGLARKTIEEFYTQSGDCIKHTVNNCQPCKVKAVDRLSQRIDLHSVTPKDMMNALEKYKHKR